MDKYRIYKLIGTNRKFGIPVTTVKSEKRAEKMCINLNRSSAKAEQCEFKVNPVFCVECAKKGMKIVALDGDLLCTVCRQEEINKFKKGGPDE